MPLPSVRAITLSVAAALSLMSAQAALAARPSAVRISLEPVTRLDPARAQADDAASFATADRMEGAPEEELRLIGNAEVRRAGSVLNGDVITYRHDTDEVTAKGNARVARGGAIFSGPSMRYRLTSRSGSMDDADWEYAPRNLRGCAKNVQFLSGNRTNFEDVMLTTCKRDDNSWFITLNDLEIDEYDQTATGTGAVLHFKQLPILASPWFSFPISNERRSGILTPTFGMSSTRGVDIMVPYYFNIAPNYDYTLTPRIMTKRGVMLGNEARFLYNDFRAQVNLDYLPNDRLTDEDRWSTHIQSSYRLGKLGFAMDYNRVSDDDYLTDFSGNIRESSETILPQTYRLTWVDSYWNAMLRVTKNQTLHVNGIYTVEPYERIPQLLLRGYNPDLGGFEVSSVIEATRFEHDKRLGGSRVVAEQTISYPFRGPGWFFVPKAKIQGNWYQLSDLSRQEARHNDNYLRDRYTNKSPSFIVPTFTADAGLIFERDSSYFGRDAYQTLEPRVFYAYTPYRDQTEIPLFDTTVADLSFATLFTPNFFAGYDRVSEANQLTAALSTRWIDKDTGLELFRASVGQRQYFADQDVQFYNTYDERRYFGNIDQPESNVRSDLLASVGARLTRSLTASTSAQYSSSLSRLMNVKAGIVWQPKRMSTVGLFYRYNYSATSVRNSSYDDNIKQIDFSVQWPITERFYALARYNYSLYKRKPIEMIGGFEYFHDCWTLRFAAQRYTTTSNEEESNFFVQLELNGLGSIGMNPVAELSRNIRGYQTSTGAFPAETDPYDYYE